MRARNAVARLGSGAGGKNAMIAKHVKGLEFLMKKHRVSLFFGFGRVTVGRRTACTRWKWIRIARKAR